MPTKRCKLWLWVAICGETKQILAIFCGKRTKESAQSIWKLVKKLHPRYIFTDKWAAYRDVLPKETYNR